jgi:hypothetical protein
MLHNGKRMPSNTFSVEGVTMSGGIPELKPKNTGIDRTFARRRHSRIRARGVNFKLKDGASTLLGNLIAYVSGLEMGIRASLVASGRSF